jgi:hypothetical protein
MKKKKASRRDDSADKPAIPLPKETEETERPSPLTPIQQAAYSAAIFATPSSD